jgi:FKBP-type peptidyl-prolyl cis-trans isomerase
MNKSTIVLGIIVVAAIGLGIFLMLRDPAVSNTTIPKDQGNPTTMEQELKIETLQEGTGEGAKKGDKVTVHYRGTLTDGTQFDASYDRGEPFTLTLGENRVIQGWEQGILGMKVGEKRKLTIPSKLGYGDAGYGPIPGKATLIFEVELLKIN